MSTPALMAFVVAAVVAGLGAPILVTALRKRLRVPMTVFFVAAGFYLLNLLIQQPIFLGVRAFHLNGVVVTGLIAPAIYAVCEESMRYLSFRAGRKMRDNRTPNGAVVAGLGHGGAEALLFTLGMVASVATAVLAPQMFAANGGDPNAIVHGGPGYYLQFALSRVLAVIAHTGFATMIMLSYRQVRWLPAAITAHFAVDASVFSLQGVLPASSPVPDLVFAGWAALAIVLLVVVRRRPVAVELGEIARIGS
ncbi:YhfC family glutamic-type intramembrane protease [Fodinicola acaciae]|uniref:YhfC family glutamic-type intramembrane protease n=1 Tax=Fodinicola acaciae TaxID=2681555 RepID=UPI0013D3AE88|nr:YhfC family glutamic-type intramembrane protease [Fodinicola acaciae]